MISRIRDTLARMWGAAIRAAPMPTAARSARPDVRRPLHFGKYGSGQGLLNIEYNFLNLIAVSRSILGNLPAVPSAPAFPETAQSGAVRSWDQYQW